MRLIDADALLEKLNYQGGFCEDDEIYNLITNAPTIKSDSASEIAELKAKVAELDGMLGKRNLHKEHEYLKTMTELQANNNTLVKVLRLARQKLMLNSRGFVYSNLFVDINEALKATPAESLQAHDNEVIEKCAKVCDEQGNEWDSYSQITHLNYAEHCAMLIRNLKGKYD